MLRVGPLVCTLVVLATIPLAAGDDDPPNPTTPVAVAAYLSGENAIVAWAPGAETPDAFNIYAVVDGSPVLLKTTGGEELSAEVTAPPNSVCVEVDSRIPPDVWLGCRGTGGSMTYAVSAMKGGVESPTTTALAVIGVCVEVDPRIPPAVVVGCTGGILGKVHMGPHYSFMLY